MEMLLTVEQAATRLQVEPETVRRRLRRGTLRGVKSGERLWRVPESALTEDSPASGLSKWQVAAEVAAPIYADSLASDGDLTDFTTAPGDFYEN
jgi:excisionase family DNA binding protein